MVPSERDLLVGVGAMDLVLSTMKLSVRQLSALENGVKIEMWALKRWMGSVIDEGFGVGAVIWSVCLFWFHRKRKT
jgi:hypothetical protein